MQAAAIVLACVLASPNPTGLSGIVLMPGGEPAAEGVVRLRVPGAEVEGAIDRFGRWDLVPVPPGFYELHIGVPGFATHRVRVGIPASRALLLPPIRLPAPTFLKMTVVSPSGERVTAVRVLRESYEATGERIADRPADQTAVVTDEEGLTRVGPLPRGISVVVIDTPPYAPFRIPDVPVGGEKALIDAGIARLSAGTDLSVRLTDRAGRAVVGQPVYVDDGLAPSLMMRAPVTSDAAGLARFGRLGPGRYRIRSRTSRPCGMNRLFLERWISLMGDQPREERLVVDGIELNLRLTSGGATLPSAEVSVTPSSTPPLQPVWLRDEGGQSLWQRFSPWGLGEIACAGATDADGLATFRYVPSGRARVSVRLSESTWHREVIVPTEDGSLTLDVPPGVAPLRVQNAEGRAVAAAVTWSAGGSRVEATVPASGDLLLRGIADGPATLNVRATGYATAELKLATPPDVLLPIVLERAPEMSLQCRVVGEDGKPIAGAAVELLPGDPIEIQQIAGTDNAGFVRFTNLSPGIVRVTASASGYETAKPVSVQVPGTATLRVKKNLVSW